ncbi:MAG: aldehyde ferredoxin oxidoreductase family protein [Sulfolobales archaeon]
MGGFIGRILDIDLTSRTYKIHSTKEEWVKLYSMMGYAIRLLYEEVRRKGMIDPLGSENTLIIVAGPLVGTYLSGSKTAFVSISPLTGYLGKSMMAGSFGTMIKRSGFDGIVLRGVSTTPVYISIVNGAVEIRSADHLWGKKTSETFKVIEEEIGVKNLKIAAIGPAGEKLCRFACIVSNEYRVAGRTGIGAVMGSKKVKAIAVYGESTIEVADKRSLSDLVRKHGEACLKSPRANALKSYGTAGGLVTYVLDGNVPIKNWSKGVFEDQDPAKIKITGQVMQQIYRSRGKSCGTEVPCVIQCHKEVYVDGTWVKHPEFETLALMGTNLLINDPGALITINRACDELGLDTISTGAVIGWAMECYERGYISKNDVGFELKWGDVDAVLNLINMIAYREGIGSILAEGVARACKNIHPNTCDFAPHVKGLEVPAHHPRRYYTIGLVYATSNIGASHLQGMTFLLERGVALLPEYGVEEPPKSLEDKVKSVVITQNLCNFLDSVGMCKFPVFGVIDFDHVAKVYSAVTGYAVDKDEVMKIGERVWYLERLLNLNLGLKVVEDRLPSRFSEEPLNEGPVRGSVCPIGDMLKLFYEYRKLDKKSGYPEPAKLKELELDTGLQ